MVKDVARLTDSKWEAVLIPAMLCSTGEVFAAQRSKAFAHSHKAG